MILDFWTIASMIMMAFYLCIYIMKKPKCNFFAYYFLAILPYIYLHRTSYLFFNQYVYMPLYFCIILSVVYNVIKKKAKINLYGFSKYIYAFIFWAIFSGIVNYSNEVRIALRNLIFFSTGVFCLYWLLSKHRDILQSIARWNLVIMLCLAMYDVIISYMTYGLYVRAHGCIYGANEFGQIAFLNLYFALWNQETSKDKVFNFIGLFIAVLSGSTGCMIATIMWMVDSKKLKNIKSKILYAGILGSVIAVISLRIFLPQTYNHFLEGSSMTDRIMLWAIFLNIFINNPITGAGLGNGPYIAGKYLTNLPVIGLYNYGIVELAKDGVPIAAHSDFIKIIAETGIIGIFLFILILMDIYHYYHYSYRMQDMKLFLGSLIFIMSGNLLQTDRMWLFLMIIVFEKCAEKEVPMKGSKLYLRI